MSQFKKIVILTAFTLLGNFAFAETVQKNIHTADSLLRILKTTKEDTFQVRILNQLAIEFANISEYDKALKYSQGAQELSTLLGFKKGIASSHSNTGNIFWYLGNYEKALENYNRALVIFNEENDKLGIAAAFNRIGIIYIMQADYEKALEFLLKSLRINEDLNDKKGMANTYNGIGVIYWKKGNYDLALSQYFKCLQLCEETGDKKATAGAYNNIGIIYNLQSNYEKALEIYLKALEIHKELGDKRAIAQSYNNTGSIYFDFGNILLKEQNNKQANDQYKKALESHFQSLAIRTEIKDLHGIAMSHNNIGSIYLKQNLFQDALYHMERSLNFFKQVGDKDGVKDNYASLADLYFRKKDHKKAYEFHKLYSELKDTLLNEESSRQIAEMNIKYDSEKKDKDLIKKDAEIGKQLAEAEAKKVQRNAFIAGFLLLLLLSFYIFRGYKEKKNANILLEEKNELIEKQKKLVEEKNIKITDSITYAKRIQQATLPSEELIKSSFPDSFVLFLPKDIVSGDFYWYAELSASNTKLIVVADCTGHGVPGAFMSMIGNTLLNEIVNVKGIDSPAEILNELNKGVVNLLNQNSDVADTQDDGMDVTVVKIDTLGNEIEYAAANHFSYFYFGNKLNVLKGDIYSIGGTFGNTDIAFTSHKLKLDGESILYLFTDGFLDQFGGENNKKFSAIRFENLLESVQYLPMEEQKKSMISAFNEWKGERKQLDDVLVLGLRL